MLDVFACRRGLLLHRRRRALAAAITFAFTIVLWAPIAALGNELEPLAPPGPFKTAFVVSYQPGHLHKVKIRSALVRAVGGVFGSVGPNKSEPVEFFDGNPPEGVTIKGVCDHCGSGANIEWSYHVTKPVSVVNLKAFGGTVVDSSSRIFVFVQLYATARVAGVFGAANSSRGQEYRITTLRNSRHGLERLWEGCEVRKFPEALSFPFVTCPSSWAPAEGREGIPFSPV